MSKPRGAACARTIRPLVLAGIVTSFLHPAVGANDAIDAIEALAPATQHAESWADLRAYAPPAPALSVLPKTPPRRRPEIFAIPTIAPTPARIPRRLLEQRIVPRTTRLQDEFQCLSTAIYFEARGESYLGQVAVAQVILNRVAHPGYPKTICDVVYQASHVRNKCQFSFACDGIADVVREPRAWRWAQRVARSVMFRNNSVFNLRRATNYHATYVSPRWARHMRRLAKIGLHVFYQS